MIASARPLIRQLGARRRRRTPTGTSVASPPFLTADDAGRHGIDHDVVVRLSDLDPWSEEAEKTEQLLRQSTLVMNAVVIVALLAAVVVLTTVGVSSLNPWLATATNNRLERHCPEAANGSPWTTDRSSWTPFAWSCTVAGPDGEQRISPW